MQKGVNVRCGGDGARGFVRAERKGDVMHLSLLAALCLHEQMEELRIVDHSIAILVRLLDEVRDCLVLSYRSHELARLDVALNSICVHTHTHTHTQINPYISPSMHTNKHCVRIRAVKTRGACSYKPETAAAAAAVHTHRESNTIEKLREER